MDDSGDKLTDRNPALIDLHLLTDTGWVVDREASTEERTIMYYTSPVDPGGVTPPFADTLTISQGAESAVTYETREQEGVSYTSITSFRDYSDVGFRVEIQADGVQEHNAQAAMLSVWGRQVTVTDGMISLTEEAEW